MPVICLFSLSRDTFFFRKRPYTYNITKTYSNISFLLFPKNAFLTTLLLIPGDAALYMGTRRFEINLSNFSYFHSSNAFVT